MKGTNIYFLHAVQAADNPEPEPDDEDWKEEFDDDGKLKPQADDEELISRKEARRIASKPRKEARNLRGRLKLTTQELTTIKEETGKLTEAQQKRLEELETKDKANEERIATLSQKSLLADVKDSIGEVAKKAKVEIVGSGTLNTLIASRIKTGDSKIKVDEKGVMTGLDEELKELQASSPELFKRAAGNINAGKEGDPGAGTDMNTMMRNRLHR